MPFDAAVLSLVRKAVESAGFEVIDAKIDGRRHLRVWIDREPDGIKVQDCATANRAVKNAMADQGMDAGAFHVEVLSPGLDRPLTRDKDFTRFQGSTVVVHLAQKKGDRRKYRGKLVGMRDGRVVVREENASEDVVIGRDEIAETRLVPEFPPQGRNGHG